MRLGRIKIFNGMRYQKLSICSGNGHETVIWARRDASRIRIYEEGYAKFGISEQLLFDFDAVADECWDVNAFNKLRICVGQSYVYRNDTITVFNVEHVNDVSDYPQVLEYHAGPRTGIVKMKFTHGTYSVSE